MNSLQKTVLLVRNAAPNDFGGAETYQVSLAKILTENNFHPVIITRSKKLLAYADLNHVESRQGWWWSRQNWSGGKVLFFPAYIVWQFILSIWYVQLIIKTGADIIHLQSKDDFIAGSIAGRLLRKNIVWTDHMDLRYVFENITVPLRNPLGKLVFWAAHFATHIILISQNEYNLVTSHFKKRGALKQTTIVLNGVIDHRQGFTNHKNKSFTFCIASRIVKNKGVEEAIRAFMILEKRLNKNDLRLDIYGDGSELEAYKKLATSSKNITFFGHQNNAIEKIASSDVFMLPSYQEGFSIALLEATMLGKAIIASNVDSNPEIIHDKKSGLLVTPRNVEQLAQAMATMVTRPEQKTAMQMQARKDYEQLFNLRNIVKNDILPLYADQKQD